MEFSFRRSYRGPLKAVIHDWAGTTVDYGSCAPAGVFVEVFRRRGVEPTLAEARGPMGSHKRDHIRAMTRMESIARQWEAKHGRPPGESDVDAMFEDFIPLQLACLREYADLIPGTIEAAAAFRERGLKIGSSSGYNREMMAIVTEEAARRGYAPDTWVAATDVPAGRPAPWLGLVNAMRLGVYPMEACVKLGDTVVDVEEGLNAGMWTVAVAKTGNELGLTEREVAALDSATLQSRLTTARDRLARAGAHYVVDSIADVPALLDQIEARLRQGERP